MRTFWSCALVATATWGSQPHPFAMGIKDSVLSRIESAGLGGRFAVSLYSQKYQRFEISLGDTAWFTPASCLKLIVTACAIQTFPKNYFFPTTITLRGALNGSTLTGNMEVTGGGDPNISARFYDDEYSVMKSWADSIKTLKIDTLRGNILFLDTLFKGPRKPPGWAARYFDRWYGAEVSALSYNDNCYNIEMSPGANPGEPALFLPVPSFTPVTLINQVATAAKGGVQVSYTLHPDSNIVTFKGTIEKGVPTVQYTVPFRNPSQFFKASFLHHLSEGGIAVVEPKEDPAEPNFEKVLNLKTVPVTNMIEEINQRSQNLYAEMLLRRLGLYKSGEASREAGLSAESQILKEMGLNPGDFKVNDACGLSRANKIRPRALASLLAHMARRPEGSDFIRSLATPGLHGARARRLESLGRRAKIKTGFINGVQGLAGYIFPFDGDTLSFALFLNDYQVEPEKASEFLDTLLTQIVETLDREALSLKKAEKLYGKPDVPKPYFDRLVYFSKQLEGEAYSLGPTGEGRGGTVDPGPVINLTQFDCLTYMESVIALAKTRGPESLIQTLEGIRYESSPATYKSRKHFFVEDWVAKSPDLVKILRFPGDTTAMKVTDKKKFFGFKKLPYEPENPQTTLSYVPYEKALGLLENWTYGKRFLGVGIVGNVSWLWVTHTGFLDSMEGGPPLFRHASSKRGKVASEDFLEYLKSRKDHCSGVVFLEFENQQVM